MKLAITHFIIEVIMEIWQAVMNINNQYLKNKYEEKMNHEIEDLPIEFKGVMYSVYCTIFITKSDISEDYGVEDFEFQGDIELMDEDGEESYYPAYLFQDTPKGAKYVLSPLGKQVRELILATEIDKLNALANERGLR